MSEVAYIRSDEYLPNGMTPLYDAIGRAVGILDEATGDSKDARAVLVIMTDGLENCSREFTRESVQGLIEASQQAGWFVGFLGQGLDVAAQGHAIGATRFMHTKEAVACVLRSAV